MTQCYPNALHFPPVKRRRVEADFSGGKITGHGGVPLLARVDGRLGLTRSAARRLGDPRRRGSCGHGLADLLRQPIYALALGHEDLNDHRELRHDAALQTAANRVDPLASRSTLCRLEQRADRRTAWALHEVLFEQFVAGHPVPPRRLVLDFNATDTPLYVFCGRHLLASYLRPSGIDASRHAWAILALLVKALRARWPKVRIVFRHRQEPLPARPGRRPRRAGGARPRGRRGQAAAVRFGVLRRPAPGTGRGAWW